MGFNNKGKIGTFEQLIREIDSIASNQSTLLIGIDGCGGSGKSTLTRKLKDQCSNVTIVHKDDFFLPSSQLIKKHPTQKPIGADFDWKRLLHQVIEPIRQNKEGRYQRYDWEKDELAEWQSVPVGGIVVIEGVYSTRKELADLYDFTIWVECPRETRLARGIERDGEQARETWENNWMISEDIYVKEDQPHNRADLIVSGI
ncbi:uridine kinase [Bacillus mesophilus]|uniref:AAA family ATPase n=1 Tax=Bacillus mesophilus TaxID=1808955 RepID=A0A6M0Q3X5_9BACI|nr:AAA family ATPase [Bacillus mesophilus]MBM7660044.1 uridine kinase [Bacillus mesophilus]NEY70904.1 AAA family ATPase [Bacillus mesophilus]